MKNEEGYAILHRAIMEGLPEDQLKRLLEIGADVNIQDEEFRTPLHHASEVGNLPLVRLFLQVPTVQKELTDVLGRTPLHVGMKL